MAITSPKELFIHELGDIYDAEQKILKMLPTMAKESDDPQVKSAFEQHEQETRQHVQNLEQCFQELGVTASQAKEPCAAIAGMKQEHDSFLKESPSKEILTMFNLGGAAKTEYYEMASYKGLIEKATLMGQQKVAQLLQQNLQQEEAMAKKVEKLSKTLGKQMAQSMK